MLRIRGRGVVLEGLVVGNVVGLVVLVTVEVCERLQPVVPLGFFVVRSKPPSKKPQLMPRALSRSPMFWPAELNHGAGGGGADVADRIGIADEGEATAAVLDYVAAGVRLVVDTVGLAGDQVDGARRRGAEVRVIGVVVMA